MNQLVIIILVQSVVFTRTLEQFYPFHLTNGPIVTYIPYWFQYVYPIPAVYPLEHQSLTGRSKFIENWTRDINSTTLIAVQSSDDLSRKLLQGFFQRVFLKIFFGGPAKTSCPPCPSCPNYKLCQTCGTLLPPAVTTFTTCEKNGITSSPSGTITLTDLAFPQCLFIIVLQLATAKVAVQCTVINMGIGSILVSSFPFYNINLDQMIANKIKTSPTSNPVSIRVIGYSPTTAATCTWSLPTDNTFTACPTVDITPAFTAASSGSIVIANVANEVVGCNFNIGNTNPVATIKVSCTTKDLGTTGDVTATFETSTTPVSVTAEGVISTTNSVQIKITNTKAASSTGSVDCFWQTILPKI